MQRVTYYCERQQASRYLCIICCYKHEKIRQLWPCSFVLTTNQVIYLTTSHVCCSYIVRRLYVGNCPRGFESESLSGTTHGRARTPPHAVNDNCDFVIFSIRFIFRTWFSVILLITCRITSLGTLHPRTMVVEPYIYKKRPRSYPSYRRIRISGTSNTQTFPEWRDEFFSLLLFFHFYSSVYLYGTITRISRAGAINFWMQVLFIFISVTKRIPRRLRIPRCIAPEFQLYPRGRFITSRGIIVSSLWD